MSNSRSQLLYNIILCSWLLSDVLRSVVYISLSPHGVALAIVVAALLYQSYKSISRGRPYSSPVEAKEYLVPLIAVHWPLMFLTLQGQPQFSWLAISLQYIGAILMLLASINLGKRFALFPQYRGLSTGGVYRLVRHPLYLSFLIFDASIVIEYWSWQAVIIYLAEVVLLAWRIEVEESHLQSHANEYAGFQDSTRYKLVPFVY